MLALVLFACFLPAILLAAPITDNENVIVNVIRPRSLTPEEHDQNIRDFWTPEKFIAAEMYEVEPANVSSRALPSNGSVSDGPEFSVEGSIPEGDGPKSKALNNNGAQVARTGRVFWQSGTGYGCCSASIVSSKTGDLVVTAGHCVFDTTKLTWFINKQWVFVPAYYNGNAPYGVWPARTMTAKSSWTTSVPDYNYDVAFVALGMLKGRHIQAYLGAQGIGFNMARKAFIYSLGYPVNLFSGMYLQLCSGVTQPSKWTTNGYVGQGIPCIMGGGCSGGPWLQNVVDSTGVGFVTSVNSFTISSVPNVMNGPFFGSNIQILYNSATSM